MLEKVSAQIGAIIDELQNNPVKEMFAGVSGGKMLRPKLMLKISQNERIHELAAIVELIHIASLLHDDVIDSSSLRRKKPTINALHGDKTAVMLGDILYSKAFSKLTTFDAKIAAKISSAVTVLSLGELEDDNMSAQMNLDEDRYLKMLYGKTGSLIEAAAVSAAMLESIDTKGIEKYSKSLGVAFQIIDDVLDITADEAALGKKPFSDFKEGKTTLPYMHLYRSGDEATKEFLKSIYKEELNEAQKERLLSLFTSHGSIEYTLHKAKEITLGGLSALKDSDIDNNLKVELEEVAKKQLERLF